MRKTLAAVLCVSLLAGCAARPLAPVEYRSDLRPSTPVAPTRVDDRGSYYDIMTGTYRTMLHTEATDTLRYLPPLPSNYVPRDPHKSTYWDNFVNTDNTLRYPNGNPVNLWAWGLLAIIVAGAVAASKKDGSSGSCYTGPRGGTYTITSGGNRNYYGC